MLPFAMPAALSRVPWKLVGLGLLLLALAVQTVRLSYAERRADRAQFNLSECREGRKEDRAAYARAQAAAAARNKAEVQRIEKEQSDVTRQVTSDLNSRLERLRRELRQKASPAGSPPHGPGAGADGRPRPGTDEEAGLCLAPDELLRAAENEERHDRLIDWVEQQLKIRR